MPTNFTYTTDIPFANNKPSVDQPNMKINTNSINSIIGVDHLTFGTATGNQSDGYHKIIHLTLQAADPAPIGTIGQLYVKSVTQGAVTDNCLFYESGGGRITQLTAPITGAGNQTSAVANNGYTYLNGGIIYQWGVIANVGAGKALVFTIPFNTKFNLQLTVTSSNSFMYISAFSNTGFTASLSAGTFTGSVYWVAIGI